MSFTLKVAFGGLCGFVPFDPDPLNPKRMRVVLIDARVGKPPGDGSFMGLLDTHFPRIGVYSKNIDVRNQRIPDDFGLDPLGQEISFFDLGQGAPTADNFEIQPDGTAGADNLTMAAPPAGTSGMATLEKAASGSGSMTNGFVDGSTTGEVAARFRLRQGSISFGKFFDNKEFGFKPPPAPVYKGIFADRMVYTVNCSAFAKLSANINGNIYLFSPDGGDVAVTIFNLPRKPMTMGPDKIVHFKWHYRLCATKPAGIFPIPERPLKAPAGGLQPIFCPQLMYNVSALA